ncbi:MAG: histidine kinase [Lachnospiraceae bacterium]|nr:histidine kinase [Lachnospiraceae bacterium]
MTTELNMPSLALPEITLLLLIVTLAIPTIMPGIDRWSKRCFIAFFSSLILNGIIFTIDMLTYTHPKALVLINIIPLLEYLTFPVPTLIFTVNMLHCYQKNWKRDLQFYLVSAMCFIYYTLHIIAYFTDYFYFSLPDGRFFMKPSHPFLFAPYIAILIIDFVFLILRHKMLSKKYFFAFLFYLIPVLIATTIHALAFSATILNIAAVISSIAMYLLVLTDQVEQYTKQQIAIANQNAKILVLQMRPHFIYNTMTSIYYLCEQNPKKAQEVTLSFTTYLRKNFNAVVINDTIPFSKELEHVNAYLSVEIAQYEDSLFVEYDIPNTDFRLPPLTLQPLVENAIKHGMDPDSESLHILIKTRKTEAGNIILVKNDGPGFDPKDVFSKNNALSNIKRRLEMMCNGSIRISSNEADGTSVEVVIPVNSRTMQNDS